MNTKCVYNNDFVLVENENNELRQEVYQDNIKDILDEENLIEQLENNFNDLKLRLNNNKKILDNAFLNSFSYFLLFILLTILFWILSGMNIFSFLVGSLVSFCCYSIFNLCELKKYLKAKKEIRVLRVVLQSHQTTIAKEKEELTRLKSIKNNNNNSKEIKEIKLNYPKASDMYSELLYDTCYNIDKLYEYYNKGKLKEKVDDKYYHVVELFVKENAPKLIRKK